MSDLADVVLVCTQKLASFIGSRFCIGCRNKTCPISQRKCTEDEMGVACSTSLLCVASGLAISIKVLPVILAVVQVVGCTNLAREIHISWRSISRSTSTSAAPCRPLICQRPWTVQRSEVTYELNSRFLVFQLCSQLLYPALESQEVRPWQLTKILPLIPPGVLY